MAIEGKEGIARHSRQGQLSVETERELGKCNGETGRSPSSKKEKQVLLQDRSEGYRER